MEQFHLFKQTSRMDNATYLQTFQSHINTIDHLKGDFGIHVSYIKDRILEAGGDLKDNAACECTKDRICKEFVAKYFLLKSDPRRYASLVATIQNDYISRQDKYPKTLSRAYDMIVNYFNPHKQGGVDPQDLGMSYYQDHNEQHEHGRGPGRGIPGRGRGRGRGRGGRHLHGVPQHQRDQDDHDDEDNYQLEQEHQQVGQTANNNSTNSHDYLRVSSPPLPVQPLQLDSADMIEDTLQSTVTETINAHVSLNVLAAEEVLLEHHALLDKWLLLDSCSTIDIVSNDNLLHDIHPTDNPIWVRCNAGRIQLTHQGFLGDYPYLVWYNPHGVANILSLENVSSKYQVKQYDCAYA
jgi:hypothetical protein